MSAAAAPWSVKGIEPKAREIAKDLARRSGMTLGEWLNTIIMEDGDDDEGGFTPLSRRPHAADSIDRRGRSRRVDDAYGLEGDTLHRLGASIDAIAARLEAAERRSTIAIQGVDQAVSGLVRRLDGQDQTGKTWGRRIDDIADELREGHKRLRRFEQEVVPKTTETFGKVETSMGALAGRLYDIEERQRSGVNELRQRMETVEKTAGQSPGATVGADLLAQVGARLDQAQGQTTEALRGMERAFAGLDQRLRATEGRIEPESAREAARFEKLAETLSRQVEGNRAEMMRRLDTAEAEGRMDRIERAVLAIGDQVKVSEERSAKAVEAMGREVLRIAQNLNGRVQTIETEVPARQRAFGEALTRKVETDMGRLAKGLEQRLTATDDRHALALEKLGGEITRISDRLSERIAHSERRSQQALEDISRRLADSSARIEQGYDRASGELAERMRMSEERTAALIAEARDTIERRTEPRSPDAAVRAAPEPDWRAATFPDTVFPDAALSDSDPAGALFSAPPFDDPGFAEQQAWSADLAPPEAGSFSGSVDHALKAASGFDPVMRGPWADPDPVLVSTPFGSRTDASSLIDEPGEAPQIPTFASQSGAAGSPMAFGQAFGGADVSDALQATAPGANIGDGFETEHDEFAGETDFVDSRALRAAAVQGRSSSTRQAIDAARAAMTATATDEAPARAGFGLKRGGKSRLQERLDKQAAKGGGTVRKALGASAIAVALTAGGAMAFGELTGTGIALPGLTGGTPLDARPIAAMAVVPGDAVPVDAGQGAELYEQATELLDAADPAAAERLKAAATAGHTPAQLHLAGLYQEGASGFPVDPVEARSWARRAADAGDAKGMHAYGMYLFDGIGGGRDRSEALAWLEKAAGRGLVDSQFNVAKLYETGDQGIRTDLAQAYKWYLIAARAGDSDAEAAVERLRVAVPAAARGQARAAADRFQVEPLA